MTPSVLALALVILVLPVPAGAQHTLQVLGPLDGRPTYATALNDHGEVVGYGFDSTGTPVPFVWTSEQGFVRFLGQRQRHGR